MVRSKNTNAMTDKGYVVERTLQNLLMHSRDSYEDARKRDLSNYLSLIGSEFSSKIGRISALIGDSHELSVGRYKEKILVELISKFIPKRYSVCSGFILFPNGQSVFDDFSSYNHDISQELDIIIYDSFNYSEIYKDGDFAIIKPEAARVVIEVKGHLNPKQIKGFVDKSIDLINKWKKVRRLYEKLNFPPLRCPRMLVMNWEVYIDKKGNPASNGKRLMKGIVKNYKRGIGILNEEERGCIPIIDTVFIYNDSIIELMERLSPKDSFMLEIGYALQDGRLTQDTNKPLKNGGKDLTIAHLLYLIETSLDTPSNFLFSRPSFKDTCANSISEFEKWYALPDSCLDTIF